MNENRLIDIETRISYQEDTLQQLNDVVINQQRRISQLEDLIKSLAERYQNLQTTGQTLDMSDEKPPHY
ncbi:MAG: SlyX protein [Gammaproteobacteria bacterium]|nr:SlyX family protein [bacterium AH-315-E07]PCH59270.1 MAG: SlyX protein [Gammaproteobacteria bacterium]